MAMTSPFRRSAMTETKKKGGGGGRGGSWHDRWKMPQGTPAPVVVRRGAYVDPNPPEEDVQLGPDGRPLPVTREYHKRKMHKRKILENGKERYLTEECSAGYDKHNPKPCAGCMGMDQGDKTLGVGDTYSLTLVHLAPYHTVPVIQQNGQILMRKDNQGPVLDYVECLGRNCNYCRVRAGHPPILQQGESWPGIQPQMIGDQFAKKRYIEIGKGHLSNLQGWDTAIGQRCGNCKADLITDGFACPTCKNLVIDMSQDPRTDAQILEAVSKPYPCLNCQRQVQPVEVISCDVCAQKGLGALQLGLFDVVCHAMRQGEGTKSQAMLSSYETYEEFEARMNPAHRTMLGGKTLRQYVEEIGQPYDFDKMFQPKPLDEQAKRLRLNISVPQYGAPSPGFMAPPGYNGGQPVYGNQPQPGGYYPPAPPPGVPQMQPAPVYAPQPVMPQGYTPAPQGYAPAPQGYPVAPPQGYPQAPQGYPVPAPGAPAPFAPYPAAPAGQPAAAPLPFQVPTKPNYG